MDVYWLEQTEADVPAENQWLSAREMLRLAQHALCQTAHRLAAGSLDGEARAGGLPQPAH